MARETWVQLFTAQTSDNTSEEFEHYNRNGIWKCPMSGESSANARTEDAPAG